MSADYRSEVRDEVDRHVWPGNMFTAWDITCALRSRGIRQSHHDLKAVVHDLYMEGKMGPEYDRTLIAVGENAEKAYLYHPIGEDPCDYGREQEDEEDSEEDEEYEAGEDEERLARLVPANRRGFLDRLLHRVRGGSHSA